MTHKIYILTVGKFYYYGSTIGSLKDRLSIHKNDSKLMISSKKLYNKCKENDWKVKISLVREFNDDVDIKGLEDEYVKHHLKKEFCLNTNRVRLTAEERKENSKQKHLKWYALNRNKKNQQNKNYNNGHKVEIKENSKTHYQKNKEAIIKRQLERYHNIKVELNEKILCTTCNKLINKRCMLRHENTTYHKKRNHPI